MSKPAKKCVFDATMLCSTACNNFGLCSQTIPVKTYQDSLSIIEKLVNIDPGPDTLEGIYLRILGVIVDLYEKERFQFGKCTAIEAIKFRMNEQGLKQKDLVPFIGSKSRVSEILRGNRKLTVKMIKALHVGLGIPVQSLLEL